MTEREPTGIPGLDDLIKGGLVDGSINLVSGAPGTGKSIFSQQFIYTGATKFKEKGMYISFEQKVKEIYDQASNFGWDFDSLEKQGKVKFIFYDISERKLPEGRTYAQLIAQEARDFNAKRLVIDSLASLANFPMSADELAAYGLISDFDKLMPIGIQEDLIVRMQVHKIITSLKDVPCTSILISEIPKESKWLSRDTVSEFMADSVIIMHYLGIGAQSNRSMVIEKMRGSKHTEDVVPFEITDKGIVVHKPEEAYKI